MELEEKDFKSTGLRRGRTGYIATKAGQSAWTWCTSNDQVPLQIVGDSSG